MPPPFLVDVDGNPYPPRTQGIKFSRRIYVKPLNCNILHNMKQVVYNGGINEMDEAAR